MVQVLICLLFFWYVCFVIGGCIKNSIIGVLIMSIGFLIFLGLRDPIENYLTTVLMKNTNKDEQQQAIIYFQFARKIVTFLLSLIVTLILLKIEMIFVYIILTIVVLIYVPIILKLYKLLK